MNRFKSRIWDKIGKVYRGNLYKYLINAETGELEVWAFSDIYDEWYNTHEDDEHLVVQQCTGLKDTNGNDIYEGDILKYSDLYYEVMWADYQWIATCPYYNRFNWPKFEYFGREARASIVCGNIFENPELLKTNE